MQSRHVKAKVLLLVSYVIFYLLYATQDFLPKWDGYGYQILQGHTPSGYLFFDPLFWFIPLVGFAFIWLAISWYLHRFKDDQILSVPFALLFVIGSYAAFGLALIGYYWNNAYLVGLAQGSNASGFASLGPTWGFVTTNFVSQLLASPFFLFVLAGLMGWISYHIVHTAWGEKYPHRA